MRLMNAVLDSFRRRQLASAAVLVAVLVLGALVLGALYSPAVPLAEQLRARADQGDAEAQFFLGLMHGQGLSGIPQDDHEAVRWYRLAADPGLRRRADQPGGNV